MNRAIANTAVLFLLVLAGTAAAQRVVEIPGGCPSLPSKSSVAHSGAAKDSAAAKLVEDAQAAMRAPTRDNFLKAISLAEEAVKSDPKNLAAYLILARAHAGSRRYLDVQPAVARQRAWENLTKAREIDPANIEVLQVLADQVVARNHDYRCAKKILERALKFDPQNARTNFYYSQLLSGMGKFKLSDEYSEKAIALADDESRDTVTVNAGRPRYMAGEYDWVLDHYTRYLKTRATSPLAHFYLSMAHAAKGQYQEALAEAKLSMPNAPKGDAGGIGLLALAYAQAGQKDMARELLNELLQRDARGEHVVPYRIAAVYEVFGERDEALRWLKKDVDVDVGLGSWLLWLNYDPIWNSERKDSRFREIKKAVGW